VAAPPRIAGTVSPGLREGFVVSLTGGLTAGGHEVVGSVELDRALWDTPALVGCDTDTCLDRLGLLIGARAVLRAGIEVVGSSNYHFRLDLYEVASHRVIGSLDDTCTVCTVHEAKEALSRGAASLVRRLPMGGASAQAVQPAPALAASSPAKATIATPRSRLYLGLGTTSLVLGLGAVGGGAALLVLDGRTQDGFDPSGQPERTTLSTGVPGAILTAAGGLLLVGGGLFLWRSHANRRPSPP